MKQFGNQRYPDTVEEMFVSTRGLWNALRNFDTGDFLRENFDFLEAVYTGARWQDVYRDFIPSGVASEINISSGVREALIAAASATPFVPATWDSELRRAIGEIENLLDSSSQLADFWKSDIFWNYHLANGGANGDIRNEARLKAFVRRFDQYGWNKISLDAAKDLIAVEGRTWTPKQLLQRLEQQGLITQKALYNPEAAARLLGVTNVVPLQKFMQDYAYRDWERAEMLAMTAGYMRQLGLPGSPEDFVHRLASEGYIRAKTSRDGVEEDGSLTLQAFLLGLPESAEALIETTMADIATALADGDDQRARGLAEDLAKALQEMAGATVKTGPLIDYILQIGQNMARVANSGSAATAGMASFRSVGDNLSLEMNEWLSLDESESPGDGDGPDGPGGPGSGGRPNGRPPVSLDEFVLRLPDSVEPQITAQMQEIARVMVEAGAKAAEPIVARLAQYLLGASSPDYAARVDRNQLLAYIQRIGTNMSFAAVSGAGGSPGSGVGGDNDDRPAARNLVSLARFRDIGSHGAGDPPEASPSLNQFVRNLPDDAEAMIQERMGEITFAIWRGDDTAADAEIERLAFSLVEESSPEDAALLQIRELHIYIRLIADKIVKKRRENALGQGADDDQTTFVMGDDAFSIDSFRDVNSHQNSMQRNAAGENPEVTEAGGDHPGGGISSSAEALSAAGISLEQGGDKPSTLRSLIRGSAHARGNREVDRLMQGVGSALLAGDIPLAQQQARSLAELILGDPGAETRPHGSSSQEVENVQQTILLEIAKALRQQKDKKAANRSDLGPGNGPFDHGPGGDPGGGAGANGTAGGNAGGGHNDSAETRSPTGGTGYDTIRRIEAERDSTALDDDVDRYVPAEISAITGLIAAKQVDEARRRAVALSERLQGLAGLAPEMSPATILKLAHGKLAALKAKEAEAPLAAEAAVKSGAAEAETTENDEPTGTLDPEAAAKLVPLVDWNTFCDVYGIKRKETTAIKALALKAVYDPKEAHAGCKLLIGRRDKGSTVKIKDEKYLAKAFIHAIGMKAEKKTLKKPMKVAENLDK